MITSAYLIEKRAETGAHQISHLEEIAGAIRDEALALARNKLGVFQQSADLKPLLDQPNFLNYFMYGLATSVAKALAANDQHVLAIYTFEPTASSDSEAGVELPSNTTVHLLVLVTRPSAALEAFVGSLDRTLTARLKELPSSSFSQRESVLDMNLVTEKDVRPGLGYAGLLSAVFAPPIKVWQREA